MAKRKDTTEDAVENARAADLPGIVRLYPLSGFAAITLDGVTYERGDDGLVPIPIEHVETAKSHFLSDTSPAAEGG